MLLDAGNKVFRKNFFDLNFGHFCKKLWFLTENFFDPPHFLVGNRQSDEKIRPDIRSILNPCQKIFFEHLIKIRQKIWKNRPPPLDSPPGRGVPYEIDTLFKDPLGMKKWFRNHSNEKRKGETKFHPLIQSYLSHKKYL